jgi:hypothetical protein
MFVRSAIEEARITALFRKYERDTLRRFWDGVGDDSFYHGPEGDFDCADIHFYMNLKGDGEYCAV